MRRAVFKPRLTLGDFAQAFHQHFRLNFPRNDAMGAASEQIKRHLLVGFLQHDDQTATRALPEKIGNRVGGIRSQRCLEDHNIGGKFLNGGNGLIEALGLADNPYVVLEGKDLAQPGAENGLGIRHESRGSCLCRLRLKTSPGSTLTEAPTEAPTEVTEVLTEVLPIRPLFLPYPSRPTCAAKLARSNCANYRRSKRYSSITTPTPRRPPSAKLRTTRPRQSTCTSASAPTTSAGREIVKSTAEPTGTSASMRNRTPLAEMFSVSIAFSVIPGGLTADFNATGSLMGKRGAPCTSV
jgi:hypothetical protein